MATSGREDRFCLARKASARRRLDMILSSRTQFSGDRTRLRTERPVRAVNTAYGRVFTIIRQRPSQKPSDRRTGHMAYLCPNFAEPVHPTHHGQPTPRACHCNNTEQRAITMRSVLVVQAELFTIIRPLLANPIYAHANACAHRAQGSVQSYAQVKVCVRGTRPARTRKYGIRYQ